MKDAPNATRAAAGALLRGRAFAGPHLAVTAGPDAGRRFALGADQTLGRGRAADLRLSDPSASRVHARLTQEGGRVLLSDLRSRNGVQVNGRRCRAARALTPGDELVVGETRLTLEPGVLDEVEVRPGAALPPGSPPPAPTPDRRPRPAALLAVAGALAALAASLLALP